MAAFVTFVRHSVNDVKMESIHNTQTHTTFTPFSSVLISGVLSIDRSVGTIRYT